jgi:hypothetical protein
MSLFRGIVSRALPQAGLDNLNSGTPARMSRYGEMYAITPVRKQHGLIDEGSYFIVGNAQTGIVTSLLGTAFAQATLSPTLIISNTDQSGNQNNKRVHLDNLHLVVTVAGAAGAALTNLLYAWTTDVGDRYASGGTDLTALITSPNTDISKGSIARVRFGALTLNAASGGFRTIMGQRQLRQQNSATAMCVAQDHFAMNFGGVEYPVDSQVDLSTAKTSAGRFVVQIPGIVVGPNACAMLHMWSPGAALTTGITFLPELGWWER